MYGLKYDNVKKGYFFHGLVAFVGIILFLGLGYTSYKNHMYKLSYDSTVIIDRVEPHRMPFIHTYYYTVDGKEYSHEEIESEIIEKDGAVYYKTSNSNDYRFERNDVIYYKSSNPNECLTENEFNSIPEYGFLPILGILIFLSGIINIIRTKKTIEKMKWLSVNGTLIQDLDCQIICKWNIFRPMYARSTHIVVNYTNSHGRTLKLVSDRKYFLLDKPKTADLLIDQNDASNFYIDSHIYKL